MGLFNIMAGLIIQEPISSGIKIFSETIGERVANIFMNALPDGSKKHFENAAAITSGSIEINGLDKKDIKNVLMDAFKEFNKQTNVSLKIPDFMETIYKALEKANSGNVEYNTNFICNNIYENIMAEADDNGGDKLKEQFKTAREVYVEKNRKAVELTAKKYSPNNEIIDELSYDNIVIAFGGDTILPFEFINELQEGICETYGISYNYNGLGNSISFDMPDGQMGEDAKSICEDLAALLENYHVDKKTILFYANEAE